MGGAVQTFHTYMMCEDHEETDLVVVTDREAKQIHLHHSFLEHLEKLSVRGRQT